MGSEATCGWDGLDGWTSENTYTKRTYSAKTPSQMDVAPWIAHWIMMVSVGIQWYCMEFDGIAGYYMVFIGISP